MAHSRPVGELDGVYRPAHARPGSIGAETLRLTVIVPFLNEEQHLPTLLASLEEQRRTPDELLLVDDGSTDGSPKIAHEFTMRHAWARVLRRPPRPPERDRMYRAHELRAFEWGLDHVEQRWDVAAKLDADLRLTPELFAEIERRFEADPRLGMAGPFLSTVEADGTLVRQNCPSWHVEGEASFFRRECWEAISPLPPFLGWDTIDEVRARMNGWRTEAGEIPGGDPVHLRRMGSYDGVLRGFRRAGLAAYAYGAHPLHVVLSGVARARARPLFLCGLSYVLGWGLAAARREPRAEPELRAYVRDEHRARMRRLLATHGQE